jgi:hypothetical protein
VASSSLKRQAATEYNTRTKKKGGKSMVTRKVVTAKASGVRAKDIARLKKIQDKIGIQLEEAMNILAEYPEARKEALGWMMRMFGAMVHYGKLDGVDLGIFSPRVTMVETIKRLEEESKA